MESHFKQIDMKKAILKTFVISMVVLLAVNAYSQEKKINVVVFGGHPDDADYKAGGTAIQFAKMGHHVLFVSVTNGDRGHETMSGKQLADIRKDEAMEAARRAGVTYKVLDNPDGALFPTLEVRHEIIRIIREWKADIVITHRPNDYHPDHRNTGVAVQDAAYLVIVPNIVPDVPALDKNPLFLYVEDRFQKPYPFIPDLCIDISDVFDQKIYAMSAHQSQYFDWLPWTNRKKDEVPAGETQRLKWLADQRRGTISDAERESLIKWYGKEKAEQTKVVESFEICEFGRQPSEEEIRQLFPMIKK